jgi:two-component system, response regulator
MSPNHDILVVNDRMLDAQETLVALDQVAPRASVLHVDSSNEALEYLFGVGAYAGRPSVMPKLILLSAEMSDVSGLCLLDLLRAHTLSCTVPIVLQSLENDVGKFRRNDKFDADVYVTKPLDFQQYCRLLESCVRCWVPSAIRQNGSRYLRPPSVPHAVAGLSCQ